jgi:hypothetical protein
VIGVVEQENIAGVNVAREGFRDSPRCPHHRADMHGHMLGLRDEAQLRVDQRAGEVARRIEDLRVGGAQHRLAHFLDNGKEPMLHQRDGDRVSLLGLGHYNCTSVRGRRFMTSTPLIVTSNWSSMMKPPTPSR